MAAGGEEAKRAFEVMMTMQKIAYSGDVNGPFRRCE